MTTKTLIPWGMIALHTEPGRAYAYRGDDSAEFSLDDLGELAEWLAVAWENVAGEEYKPVVISRRGYVADLGMQLGVSGDDIPGFVDSVERLERDCE